MEKKMVVALVLTFLVVLLLSYAGGYFSGKSVFYEVEGCTDSDAGDRFPDGKDYGVRGITKSGKAVYRDTCDAATGDVIEYYCNDYGVIESVEKDCGEFGCSTGRCRDFPRQ